MNSLKMRVRRSRYARHIMISIGLIMTVLAIGTVGYMLIEGVDFHRALYMTVITISTVGFREVDPPSTAGMYFTIFMIGTGVSAVLFFLAGLFEFMLSEVLGDLWGRKRMLNNVARLASHYIICGYGRVGRSVAEELADKGRPFVVIEQDEEVFKECVRDGHLAVMGSATENELLVTAGIEHAVGLVSALHTDADNLFVILTARTMNPSLLLVARADQPESEHKLEMVGADRVVSPHKLAGRRMANLMVSPGACEFLDASMVASLPEFFLSELIVSEGSSIRGETVKSSRLRERTGVSILAVRKAGEKPFNLNPPVDMTIEKGDMLVLIGTPAQMALVERENTVGE